MSISVYQLPSGKWRADVSVKTLRRSKVERLKSKANAWARMTEADLTRELATINAMRPGNQVVCLDYAIERYSIERSPKKATYENELKKIKVLRERLPHPDWPVDRITGDHLSAWRDDMVAHHAWTPGTVLRYFSLLSAIFEWARKDKKWVTYNPCKDVEKPPKPEHRDRRIIGDEIEAILAAGKYRLGSIPTTMMHEVVLAWLIGISCGMRVSEIIRRKRGEVDVVNCSVRIPNTKNGFPRLVPIDGVAVKLWTIALMMHPKSDKVFSVSETTRYATWYRIREDAGLGNADLKFHDSRHEAASQLAKKMGALPLAKVFGWRDLNFALTYYNPTHDELLDYLYGRVDSTQVNDGHVRPKGMERVRDTMIRG